MAWLASNRAGLLILPKDGFIRSAPESLCAFRLLGRNLNLPDFCWHVDGCLEDYGETSLSRARMCVLAVSLSQHD